MENPENTIIETKNTLEISTTGLDTFLVINKWTKFLSILGFVFLGILVLVTLVLIFGLSFFNSSNIKALTIIPLTLVMVIYFFPIYYLYQFSTLSKTAIKNNDSNMLENALKFLKLHYRFLGILIIVFGGIYIILGIIALISKIL